MKNQYEEDAFEIVHSKEFLKVGSTLKGADPIQGGRRIVRRKILTGAAALAASAVTMKTASAASVAPLGQTGAPTTASPPLPLGPLPGARYPDSRLES